VEKLKELFAYAQSHPWPTAGAVVLIVWYLYESREKLLAKFSTLNPFGKETVTTIDTFRNPFADLPPFVPAQQSINEQTLADNERQQVFYYLERIRSYAEATKNTEASKDCVSLLNNLFKDFKSPAPAVDPTKGVKS